MMFQAAIHASSKEASAVLMQTVKCGRFAMHQTHARQHQDTVIRIHSAIQILNTAVQTLTNAVLRRDTASLILIVIHGKSAMSSVTDATPLKANVILMAIVKRGRPAI